MLMSLVQDQPTPSFASNPRSANIQSPKSRVPRAATAFLATCTLVAIAPSITARLARSSITFLKGLSQLDIGNQCYLRAPDTVSIIELRVRRSRSFLTRTGRHDPARTSS
jgi:hypothetical protein